MKLLDLIKEWLYMMFLTALIVIVLIMAITCNDIVNKEKSVNGKVVFVYPEQYKIDHERLNQIEKLLVQYVNDRKTQSDRMDTIEKNLFDRLIPIEEASRKKVVLGNRGK